MRITVFLVLVLLIAVAPQAVVGAAQAVVDAAVGVLDGLIDEAAQHLNDHREGRPRVRSSERDRSLTPEGQPMAAAQPDTKIREAPADRGGFGADIAWSPRMATGHRIALATLECHGPADVDEAHLRAVARRQVRRVVDQAGHQRGWLLFGQLRPGLTARLLDLYLQQRQATTLTAEMEAGRVGDHLRLAYAPASARPPLDPEIAPTRWPVTVLDAQPTQPLDT